MPEFHPPFADGELPGARLFLDFRLRVEDGEDAVRRAERFLDISYDLCNAPGRIGQIDRINQESDQLA